MAATKRTAIGPDRPGLRRDGPVPATRRTFLATMAALIGPTATAQDGAEGRARSSARLATMRRLAEGVRVHEVDEGGRRGSPLVLRPEPLLRYSDPGRNAIDGTLWGWGEGERRPPAVMKLELRGPARGQRHWALNVTALSPRSIEVEFANGQRWSSRPPGLRPQSVPDAPAPADTAGQRLAQAKVITRRVSIGVETNTIGRIQLRLLPTPIASYRDDETGLLSGVLFEFVYSTNPVVVLALEARSEGDGARTWRYAFARQGTGQATALLDGKSVWSVPAVIPPVDSDTYMTRPMPASPADQD